MKAVMSCVIFVSIACHAVLVRSPPSVLAGVHAPERTAFICDDQTHVSVLFF